MGGLSTPHSESIRLWLLCLYLILDQDTLIPSAMRAAVRDIFYDQPTRRFVHAFTLCASTMELWVFDIHEKPDTFARALVSYATMDDHAMGRDTFIERGGRDQQRDQARHTR